MRALLGNDLAVQKYVAGPSLTLPLHHGQRCVVSGHHLGVQTAEWLVLVWPAIMQVAMLGVLATVGVTLGLPALFNLYILPYWVFVVWLVSGAGCLFHLLVLAMDNNCLLFVAYDRPHPNAYYSVMATLLVCILNCKRLQSIHQHRNLLLFAHDALLPCRTW